MLEEGVVDTNLKCSVLLDSFLEDVKSKTSSDNYRKTKYHINNYIRPSIGQRKINSLTTQQLQSIIDLAFRTTNHKKDDKHELSRKSLIGIRSTISAFLKYCRKQNITTLSGELLEIPKAARYQTRQILQPDALKILFNVDTTLYRNKRIKDPNINAYRFAVLTGVRPGKLKGLEWTEIFDNSIHLTKSINSWGEITSGKNENAIRSITLSPLAQQVLKAQFDDYYDNESNYVFPVGSTQYFLRRWKQYCISNDIPTTTLYELRHTFVSIAKSLPEGTVKSIVGHSKQMDTFGVYSHALTNDAEEVSTALQVQFEKLLK